MYVGADLAPQDLARVLLTLLAASGVKPLNAPPEIEITRRRAGDRTWTYVLNHTAGEQRIDLSGKDLLTGDQLNESSVVGPFGVRVVEAG